MSPVYVIAEMAWSHDGSVALAEQIARDAVAAGANALSIHITHMPDYMVRHYGAGPGRVSAGKDVKPVYDYLSEINLSFDDWRRVAATARAAGLDLIVMPNDMNSLEFAATLPPQAYVLSAACFEELDFIAAVGQRGLPVYLRVGGATLGEIETAVNTLRRAGNARVTLLYGHQNYPTKVEDTNLGFIATLKQTFGLPVGIADHIDADDDFALTAPLLAVPLGIACIEKHLTHDRGKKGEDFESALNRDEFGRLVANVRKAERALGNAVAVGLDDASARYRAVARKRLVAARDIPAGAKLAAADLIAKRADEGVSPVLREVLIGRTAQRDIVRDQGITFDLLTPAQ